MKFKTKDKRSFHGGQMESGDWYLSVGAIGGIVFRAPTKLELLEDVLKHASRTNDPRLESQVWDEIEKDAN